MTAPTPSAYPSDALPRRHRLGEYVIEDVLGYGGFGITYLAHDTRLNARVAIKEYFPRAYSLRAGDSAILPKVDATSTAALDNYRWGLQEFLKEARALAQFKHPNIVRVLRFLEENNTAYMVMDYEDGESLAASLRKRGGFLDEPTLLAIFLPLLNGLQAVHDAGILHLDIKPENIYLRANGQPMLIDFGSARQILSGSDRHRQVALTPGYCALEQYPGHGEVGPASDVYAVGATLYRCITGKTPVDALERHQTFARRRVDPLVPATAFDRPRYAACIRKSVERAMRLDPRERPPSAYALQQGLMGQDIERAAQARPVQGPAAYSWRQGFIGVVRSVTPHARRRGEPRSFFEKLVATLVFLAAVAIVTPKILIDLGRLTQDELYDLLDAGKAAVIAKAGEWQTRLKERLFGAAARRAVPAEPTAPQAQAAVAPPPPPAEAAVFAPARAKAHTLARLPLPVEFLAFLDESRLLAAADGQGLVRLWDTENGRPVASLRAHPQASGLAVSPDGRWLALPVAANTILLWDAQTRREDGHLAGHPADIAALTFSPDGRLLVSADVQGNILLWDLEARRLALRIGPYEHEVLALALSPNNRLLVAGHTDGGVTYWDIPSGKRIAYSPASSAPVLAVAFSPDGEWLATGGDAHLLKLWRIRADVRDVELTDAPETVHALAFSPDGEWLIAAGTDKTIGVWNVRQGRLAERLDGESPQHYALALSPGGHALAAGGYDRAIRVWK